MLLLFVTVMVLNFQDEELSTLSFTATTDLSARGREERLTQSINKGRDIKTTANLTKRVRTKCLQPPLSLSLPHSLYP